jgi:hypothetical protein
MNNQETTNIILYQTARKAAMKTMFIGIGFIMAGIGLSLITFAMFENTDFYFVFSGLAIYGADKALRGIYYSIFPQKLVAFSEASEANRAKWTVIIFILLVITLVYLSVHFNFTFQ